MKNTSEYYAHHIEDTVVMPDIIPVFKPGMPKKLFIRALNGTELFIEDRGAYRASTQAEYESARNAGVNLNNIPQYNESPFT